MRCTANIGTRSVRFSPGDIAAAGVGRPRGLPSPVPGCWTGALDARRGSRHRTNASHLTIVDLDPLGAACEALTDPAAARSQVAELRAQRPT